MHRCVQFACVVLVAVGALPGCGENATLFNPSFVNFAVGGVVPLVPGPNSGFILARVVNNTPDNIRFVVTAERETEIIDEEGVSTIETTYETVRLPTFPTAQANEVGILFDCPVARVGLGENIDFPGTEPGLFIGAVPGEQEGFGVPGSANPLAAKAGNYDCGDTLIFEAASRAGTVGNVRVSTFVLDADEQPTQFSGPDTFNNARSVIEEYSYEE